MAAVCLRLMSPPPNHDSWLGPQAALSGCSRLRHLALCEWKGRYERLIWGASHLSLERAEEDWRMVETLSEKLPSLAVLELQVDGLMSLHAAPSGIMQVAPIEQSAGLPKPQKRDRLHFDQELIRSVVQSEAAGMQMLHIDCGFGPDQMDCMRLPPTLRYLSSPCRSVHALPCQAYGLSRKLQGSLCRFTLCYE